MSSHYQREPISISDCGSNSQPPLTRQSGWREQQTGGGVRGSGQLKWRDGVRERVELKGLKGKATEIRREKERAQK